MARREATASGPSPPRALRRYRTRIIVRVPTSAQKFNGTLLVEWFNVTTGSDTDPVLAYAGNELTRAGYGWVGVSVQKVGVSGGGALLPVGAIAAGGLVGTDPARYGSLHHPGDQYALDIYSQVARGARAPRRARSSTGCDRRAYSPSASRNRPLK